jgi:hypothetical protein
MSVVHWHGSSVLIGPMLLLQDEQWHSMVVVPACLLFHCLPCTLAWMESIDRVQCSTWGLVEMKHQVMRDAPFQLSDRSGPGFVGEPISLTLACGVRGDSALVGLTQ